MTASERYAGLPESQQSFAGARSLDPLVMVGWNLRQKEIDELRAEVKRQEDMAFDLTERLLQSELRAERLLDYRDRHQCDHEPRCD